MFLISTRTPLQPQNFASIANFLLNPPFPVAGLSFVYVQIARAATPSTEYAASVGVKACFYNSKNLAHVPLTITQQSQRSLGALARLIGLVPNKAAKQATLRLLAPLKRRR
jgi:hypothetical protein